MGAAPARGQRQDRTERGSGWLATAGFGRPPVLQHINRRCDNSHPEGSWQLKKILTSEVPEWARGDPLMRWYATEVWGRKIDDDNALFEIMGLQVFQAGLTWRMILARRDAFRQAFHGWRIDRVAAMGPDSVDRLVQDAAIIRNRKKIEACNRQRPAPFSPSNGTTAPFVTGFTMCFRATDLGELPESPPRLIQVHGTRDSPDVAYGQRPHRAALMSTVGRPHHERIIFQFIPSLSRDRPGLVAGQGAARRTCVM